MSSGTASTLCGHKTGPDGYYVTKPPFPAIREEMCFLGVIRLRYKIITMITMVLLIPSLLLFRLVQVVNTQATSDGAISYRGNNRRQS